MPVSASADFTSSLPKGDSRAGPCNPLEAVGWDFNLCGASDHMVANSINWKRVQKQLAAKRKGLFKRFVKDPAAMRLAAEIKWLDDQMFECNEHIERQRMYKD
jgi:hypothetical protein